MVNWFVRGDTGTIVPVDNEIRAIEGFLVTGEWDWRLGTIGEKIHKQSCRLFYNRRSNTPAVSLTMDN